MNEALALLAALTAKIPPPSGTRHGLLFYPEHPEMLGLTVSCANDWTMPRPSTWFVTVLLDEEDRAMAPEALADYVVIFVQRKNDQDRAAASGAKADAG